MDDQLQNLFPFFGTTNSLIDDAGTKLEHDRYEVYVNGDFVGIKTLFTQNEDVTDLNDFLREQGIRAFQATQNGDHYEIDTEEPDEQIKQTLHVYLQNR